MSQVIPTVFAQVVIEGLIHGQQTRNIWNFARTGPAPVDNTNEMTGLATKVIQVFRDAIFDCLSVDWSLSAVRAAQLYPVSSDEHVVLGGALDHGGKGIADVSFAAALAHLRTGLKGRSNRGRTFFPGVATDTVANSKFDDPTMLLFQAAKAEIETQLVGSPSDTRYALTVLSRKILGPPPSTNYLNATKFVTNVEFSNIVAVMRSRRIGHGG